MKKNIWLYRSLLVVALVTLYSVYVEDQSIDDMTKMVAVKTQTSNDNNHPVYTDRDGDGFTESIVFENGREVNPPRLAEPPAVQHLGAPKKPNHFEQKTVQELNLAGRKIRNETRKGSFPFELNQDDVVWIEKRINKSERKVSYPKKSFRTRYFSGGLGFDKDMMILLSEIYPDMTFEEKNISFSVNKFKGDNSKHHGKSVGRHGEGNRGGKKH